MAPGGSLGEGRLGGGGGAATARGIPRHAWEGNRRADELAGQSAATHAVAEQEMATILWGVDATERAQLWMAEALQKLAEAWQRKQ